MRERNQQVTVYLRTIISRLPIWTLLIPCFILLSTSSSFAQPANDDCNSPTPVPTDGTCIDGNNTNATADVGNGSCAANGGTAPNIWFSFVADGTDYDITAPGLAGSAEITLIRFDGAQCDFGAAVEIDCGVGNINGTGLTPGQQYFISITSSNGSEGNLSVCVTNLPTDPPPPNDDPCSPTPIPPDGSCTTGTTVSAGIDWSNPNCPNLASNSVWYSVTLTGTNNSLDVNIGNQTIMGDVSVMIGTFTPDCTGGFAFVAQYCGPPMTTITAPGLMPGGTYFIVVSTEDANEGIFDICVTEMGPPSACAANDLCANASDISGTPIQNVCLTGCNTGVGPDATGGAGCFDFSAIPTVWYTFTTDANTANVTINLSSPSFDQPQVALFEGACPGIPVDCNLGAGGSVILNSIAVMPNTTYQIAVGSIGGQEGDFTICVQYQGAGGTNCITSGDVQVTSTSLGSPLSGPFQPAEVVNFCFQINWTSTGNNCQWLHGVVPTFGDCWDPISFTPDGMPVNVTAPLPNSQWYPDGDVFYNDLGGSGPLPQGAPVGAGWFVVGVNNNGNLPGQCGPNDFLTDPNCSFGIPMACNSTATFQVCFDLTAKDFDACDGDASAIDCGVSFKTYGDGETGGWGSAGCEADIPIFGNYSLNCCIGPEMLFLPITTCSGVQLDVFLDDYLLPPSMSGDVSYTWTVSAPGGITGASDCLGSCGVILSQILTNTTGGPLIVTYTITPRSLDGCLGLPYDLSITVLPEVEPMIDNPTGAICSGACALLFGSATGGNPPYSYEWSTGDMGITTEVCPTFTTAYQLTVTDANDCTGVEEIIVEANPNLLVDIFVVPDVSNTPDYIEMCDQDPTFPLTLSAFADLGGPGWLYNWDIPSGTSPSPFVQATMTGFYSVTLTDPNGCTGESEVEVVIHPSPTIILFPAGPFCEGDPPQTLTVVTIPSGGMGSWIGNFNGNEDFVPDTPGPNTVYYSYEDGNGCMGIDSMVIQVNPIPGDPTITTSSSPVCSDETNITYCVDAVADATYYNWDFPPGVTIVSGDSTTCVVVDWNNAPAGNICVAAGNDCGESGSVCIPIVVDMAPPVPTGLVGPETPCVNEAGLVYTINAVPGANDYTWTVTGGTITAGAGSTSITVTWGTAAGTVCVVANNDCGSSGSACLNINPISPPVAPVLVDPGPVCAGDNNVVYTIAAVPGATTYNWTVPAGATFTGNGTTSITVDWGSSTGGDICVNAANACGNSPDACITITPETPPSLAGPVIGPDVVCANDAGIAYSIGAAAGATGYTWTITGGTQASGGSTNAITVDWGAGPAGQVCVTADNNCGSSPQVCANITINSAPVAPTAPADGTICQNTTGDVYSIPAIAGATTYNWTVPAPATFTGQGTTSIVIDWTGAVSPATICVNAGNACGDSPDACFTITPTLIPAQPGPISGPADPCNGSTGITYSIAAIPGATSYNWTVPPGATFTGNGTNTIMVDWGLSPGGSICVNAQNSCGSSPDQCFVISPFGPPSLGGPLDGLTTVCANANGVAYSVPAASGADGYTWVITGGTQASGGNTSMITVDWGAGPIGEVCVTADNTCGSSSPLCINVTIDQVPATPTAPADDVVCTGDMGVIYTVPVVPGATSYNWTFPAGATVSGNGTNTVNVDWGTATSGTVCVNAQNDCGLSPDACFNVTINDVPAAPTGLTGNDLLCQDTNGEVYSIDAVAGATSYVWNVSGSGTIASGQGSTSITVDWGNAGGNVCVYAVNDCGDGPQVCLPVVIDLILAPPSVSCGTSTTNSVIFNWSHPTATEFEYTYTINGGAPLGPFTTMDLNVTIPGLTANDEVVISIIALGGTNVCGNSPIATQLCEANDCTLNPPTINGLLAEYCVNETGITFTGTPTGGTFSGPGVAANGDFDPSGLPAGLVTITYEYIDGNGCPQSVNANTTIVFPIEAPTISCNGSTSSEVSFLWSHPTATMFEYYYTVNGGLPTATTATSLMDLTIPGLMEGDMVELFVIAIGNPPCGNSIAGSQVCDVQICPNTPPLINGINDPYCENDNSLIVFDGVPNTGTFSGAGIDSDGTFHPDALPVGLNPITYSYVDNIGCLQSTTVDIEVVGILVPPEVSCGVTTQSSVSFNWFHPNPGVTEFIYTISINGQTPSSPVTTMDQTVEITGLSANDIVTISVIAVGINVCGNSEAASFDCVADDCQNNPPSVPIDPEYCINDAPVQLVASAGSGVYSGSPGVSANGLWSPAAAGVGPASITYDYDDVFGCPQTVTVNTVVVDIIPAPQVICQGSTTNEVTFDITSAATDFEYTYTINSGPVQGPFTSNTTTIVISGLAVNDVVDITVIAIGGAPCGNSAPGTASCQAQDCPVNPPTLSGVASEYCVTETDVLLSASPVGGTFAVDGIPFLGNFNPSNYSLGAHTISYSYIDMSGCPQTTSAPTTIVGPPAGPGVFCLSSNINSVSFDWDDYPGATDYSYTYSIDGGPIQGPFTTATSEVTIPGLTANQVVNISVVANGLTPCTQSLESTAQCEAKDCLVDVQIDPVSDFCLDGTQSPVTLTVVITNTTGTGTGVWSGNCLTGPNNDIFDPNLCGLPGIQNITYTFDEDGCTYTDIIQINVFGPPVAEAGPPIDLTCDDLEKELNGIGSSSDPGTTYLWTGPGTIVNETTLAPTVDAIGLYTLTVTSPEGCTATDQVMVGQDGDIPVVTAGPPLTLTCILDKVNLVATSNPATGVTYLWTGPDITTMNENDVSPEITIAGDYFVIVKDDLNGCESPPLMITVLEDKEAPQVVLVNPSDTLDCVITSLTFDICTAQPGYDNTDWVYQWLYNGAPVPNGNSCSIMIETPAGVYTYIILDTISGCSTTGQVEVIDAVDFPLADAGDDAVLDCNISQVTLQGGGTQSGPGIEYLWTGPGIVGPDNGISVDVNLPGTYTIEVLDAATGCSNVSSANVDLNEDTPNADGGPDLELDCDFTPVSLDGSGSTSTGSLVFQWLAEDGSDLGQNSSIQVNEPGIYALAIEDIDNGCVDTTLVIVTPNSNAPQDAILDVQDPDCFGDTDGYINIVEMVGGTPPYNYSFDGQTFTSDPFITNLAPGVYNILVEDAAGCEWDSQVTVTGALEIGFDLGADIELQMGDDIILNAGISLNDSEISSISWTPTEILDCLDDPCRTVSIEDLFQTTNVRATVVDTNGCEAQDEIQLRVKKDRLIYIPSGFSPNADGANDFFVIQGGRGVEIVETFQIFDRWGEIVYEASDFNPNDPAFGWDGTLKGKDMNPAVFVYFAKVKFIDGYEQIYRGDVTLIR